MSANFLEQLELLPHLLAPHVLLTAIALLSGILLSVPTAVLIVRLATLRYPVLTGAGIIQTIPSLALLALMVPLLELTGGLGLGLNSFGFWPAVIALTLYSILPILRNTVTGILNVDRALREAARGLGMTDTQMLLKVELPLAAPVIIAGIRTAAVWVVGIGTLATPVGQRCLGNFIFAGLQTRNWTMVLFGVVSAATLAILLDLLIAGLQRATEARHRGLMALTGLATVAALVAGLMAPRLAGLTNGWAADAAVREAAVAAEVHDLGPIRIGSKTFTEQYILAGTVERLLTDAGFATDRTDSLGSTIIFDQLRAGGLDVYVDYSGTIWANYMSRSDTAAPQQVLDEVGWWLASQHRIRCVGALGFENAYALALPRARATELGIRTIRDLAAHTPALKIGGDYEFFGRPEWRQLRDTYGLAFAEEVSFDATLMYDAVVSGQVDVIAAFSSDGRIAAFDLVVLEDPDNAVPPYDALLLLGPRVADSPAVLAALTPLVGAIDVTAMQQANQVVDIERRPVSAAADQLLEHIRR
jgi:osmoprotectant transport system permease protein